MAGVPVPLTLYLARKDGDANAPSAKPPTQADIDAASEAAYRKGFDAGVAQAKVDCDAALARKEAELNERLAEARKDWSQSEGAVLSQRILDAIAALRDEIEATAARILRPFLANALAEEAIVKLAGEIEKLLSDEDAIRLRVSGPADLVAKLSERLPSIVTFTAATGEAPEVTVYANKTVIETNLTEWLECIGVDGHASCEEKQRHGTGA